MIDTSQIDGKRILVTGGTGSLGKMLINRLLLYKVKSVRIFSRDEAKQYFMSKQLPDPRIQFQIGDIRNLNDVVQAMCNIDIVFNAAALKQVPNCEYNPSQAVMTNIHGADNIVKAILLYQLPVETVVGISTDKACSPCNIMGMTKAIQERIFIHGNLIHPATRFVCTRYGNVLASRGSLIPLFHQLMANSQPLTVTSAEMTRFLMNLDEAVDLILEAVCNAYPGETFIPGIYSGRIIDIAKIFSELSGLPLIISGMRPGEKLHEVLINEVEAPRTKMYNNIFVIRPEIEGLPNRPIDLPSYEGTVLSSASCVANKEMLFSRLDKERLLPGQYDLTRFN